MRPGLVSASSTEFSDPINSPCSSAICAHRSAVRRTEVPFGVRAIFMPWRPLPRLGLGFAGLDAGEGFHAPGLVVEDDLVQEGALLAAEAAHGGVHHPVAGAQGGAGRG